jgi:hypothetical protein
MEIGSAKKWSGGNWGSGQLNRRAGKRHPGAVDIWDISTASTRIN